MKNRILIKGVTEDSEGPAIILAAEQIRQSLNDVGESIVVDCDISTPLETLKSSQEPCIVITSLLGEVANYAAPWSEAEARLRARYCELTKSPSLQVFILTVFRHVSGSQPEQCELMRIRIRRLNRLAAELSREYGIMVIDTDRDFADVGARRLETDYRLIGDAAQSLAAKGVALAILSAGLDDYASFEAQDAAKQLVLESRLDFGAVATTEVKPSNILSLGAGRRRQTVKTVVDTNSQNHASWLANRFLSGQFSIGDAFSKLKRSIARRGLRVSLAMSIVALREALHGRKKV